MRNSSEDFYGAWLKIILSFWCGLVGSFLVLFLAPFSIFSGYRIAGVWSLAIGTVALAIAYWLNLSLVVWRSLIALNLLGFLALSIWTIPVTRRLPEARYTSVDGVITIEDAVKASQKTNLEGWALVEFAQHLTARKFSYSRRNPWDSPSRAFERGLGYCQQQALALNAIYEQLGIDSRVVYATRCRFPSTQGSGSSQPARVPYPSWLKAWFGDEEDVLGHCWLRVRVEETELDVCPGNINNKPGKVHFEILSPVRTLHPFIRPFTHLGSVMLNLMLEREDH